MAFLLLLPVIASILYSQLVEGLQMGALVTIHQQDVSSVFFEWELFGVRNRTRNNTITIEVVFDEKRLIDIRENNKIVSFKITIPDYDVVISKEFERINNRTVFQPGDPLDIFFNEFRPWWEYIVFIDTLLLQYPAITNRSYLGETLEGRDIPIITLTPDEVLNPDKPGFYIQASVHSNEWLANSATAYILKELCERWYNNDVEIQLLLENMNIFIVPTVNIDGYLYTWDPNGSRNWRKNRRRNIDDSYGVDLNRNYGPATWQGQQIWGLTPGASHDPTSNNYCGTGPFSEPETQAVSQFLSNSMYNIKAAVDMHTTGPYILWPWGYTTNQLPPIYYNQYSELGASMQEAASINGQNYESIQSATWYLTSGVFHDYVVMQSEYDALGFTFEGPSINSADPPQVIVDAGEEQMTALIVLARSLIE